MSGKHPESSLCQEPRVAVIGCGYWGKNLVRNLRELGNLELICDVDESRLQELAETYAVRSTPRMDEVLREPKIRGVVIAAPAAQHFDIAKKALLAGKDVFVEKPIAFTTEEAKEMIRLAQEKKAILQVGHIYRYHPATAKIKKMIEEGRLGDLQYAYGHFMGFKRPRTDVGVTQTDAIHYFDFFN